LCAGFVRRVSGQIGRLRGQRVPPARSRPDKECRVRTMRETRYLLVERGALRHGLVDERKERLQIALRRRQHLRQTQGSERQRACVVARLGYLVDAPVQHDGLHRHVRRVPQQLRQRRRAACSIAHITQPTNPTVKKRSRCCLVEPVRSGWKRFLVNHGTSARACEQ